MRITTTIRLLAALTAILLLATSGFSQVSSPIKVYAGGGLSEQHKPPVFSDWYKSGWHMTAGVGHDVMPWVELVGSFEYHTFSNNLSGIVGGTVEGGDIKAAMFGLQARVKPSIPVVPIKPYGLAGIGMANVKLSKFDWPPETKIGTVDGWQRVLGLEDQTKFYYSFGGGVMYSLFPKVSLFAEARYSTIQIDGGDTAFDNPLRFWAITGGVRLL